LASYKSKGLLDSIRSAYFLLTNLAAKFQVSFGLNPSLLPNRKNVIELFSSDNLSAEE
jgi:hypothetical protein